MPRHFTFGFCVVFASSIALSGASARNLPPPDSGSFTPLVGNTSTLAPFQHIRFCLRYPSECKSSSSDSDRIDMTPHTAELLNRVNTTVNLAIAPREKSYGGNLEDSWTISPSAGDCNDYAVTKRHELIKAGLPSSALRLSVVRTPSGIGHLVLVVATTKGDLVMDNLRETLRSWRSTGYQWLKIQSQSDPRYWQLIEPVTASASLASPDRNLRVAGR